MLPKEDLPPALSSMWRALKRGYDAEPSLLIIAFALSLLAALPDALLALWLKFLADGVLEKDNQLVLVSAIGLGVTAAATWFLRVISDRTQRRFRDRVTIALESHVANLQASVSTIEHHERPEYLDRLAILRDQVFVLDHMYMSLFTTCGWVLRLIVTIALLVSVHPALTLLILFALPTVLTSTWRPAVERETEERVASSNRLARHLFDLGTTAPPGKEVRVTQIEEHIVKLRRQAFDTWYKPVAHARRVSAMWHTLGWMLFAAGYVGAIVFVATVIKSTAGDVLLVLAAGSRLSAYIGATVGEIGFLRGIWMDGSIRMAWLEDYATAQTETADLEAPSCLTKGITFQNVSFHYPGTDKKVLDDVSITLDPDSVIAIVGENGAGKTTLVKLLCQLYKPTSGSITIDDLELTRISPISWREKLAGAFQDFYRFEYKAKQTVGVGDVPKVESELAIHNAVDRAGAKDVVSQLLKGLETQLGPTWPEGVEVSFGQWQKLALARGFMREEPLLLILDEPTAALDAETEHALFERYAAATRSQADTPINGRITILVSHRFSTVRMADKIIVLDGSKIAESGSHEDLMRKNGQYAELYTLQSESYR